MFSQIVTLRPNEHPFHIAWIAAIAVGEAAQEYVGNSAKLIWHQPNDIWCQMEDGILAKLGGLLVAPESISNNGDKATILGIGINLNSAPPPNAAREGSAVAAFTCLKDCGAKKITIGSFLGAFDLKFKQYMTIFREQSFNPILERIGYATPEAPGRITLKLRDTEKAVTGSFMGFETRKEKAGEEIIDVNFIRLKDNQEQMHSIPVGNLNMPTPIRCELR